jgi:hypothetical protein
MPPKPKQPPSLKRLTGPCASLADRRAFAPTTTVEYTSFHVRVATDRALDLTTAPFAEQEGNWISPDDYTACQDLATQARGPNRLDPHLVRARGKGQCNIVVLTPEAFEVAMPTIHRTWHFRHQGGRLSVLGAFPSEDRHEFSGAEFGL